MISAKGLVERWTQRRGEKGNELPWPGSAAFTLPDLRIVLPINDARVRGVKIETMRCSTPEARVDSYDAKYVSYDWGPRL